MSAPNKNGEFCGGFLATEGWLFWEAESISVIWVTAAMGSALTAVHCWKRAWNAGDAGNSVQQADRVDAIAGKPAPTFDRGRQKETGRP